MRRSMRVVLTTVGAVALLAIAGPAHADAPGTPRQPPPVAQPGPAAQMAQPVPTYRDYQRRQQKSHWYGWQTLIVDGGVIVGSTVLAGASGEAAGVLLVTGYFFGGPIVHWSHGQVGRGFADLGIRVGAPLVLATLGYLVFNRGGSADVAGAVGAVLGFGLGVVAAIVIDASALAYEKVGGEDDEDAQARSRRRHALRPATVTPWAAPRTEGGAMFGFSGTLY